MPSETGNRFSKHSRSFEVSKRPGNIQAVRNRSPDHEIRSPPCSNFRQIGFCSRIRSAGRVSSIRKLADPAVFLREISLVSQAGCFSSRFPFPISGPGGIWMLRLAATLFALLLLTPAHATEAGWALLRDG